MKKFQIQIRVRFKDGILDPQAEAVTTALKRLDFKTVQSVECDKVFVVSLSAEDKDHAHQLGRQMASQLLANVVMENFDVEVLS